MGLGKAARDKGEGVQQPGISDDPWPSDSRTLSPDLPTPLEGPLKGPSSETPRPQKPLVPTRVVE